MARLPHTFTSLAHGFVEVAIMTAVVCCRCPALLAVIPSMGMRLVSALTAKER